MDAMQRKMRQVQRMAEAAEPLQPAENHPGPGRGHTKKPHEKACSVLKVEIDCDQDAPSELSKKLDRYPDWD